MLIGDAASHLNPREFAETDDAVGCSVAEIARRSGSTRGTVLEVRSEDLPGGSDLAAILRYSF